MSDPIKTKNIKEVVGEFLEKMTIEGPAVEVGLALSENGVNTAGEGSEKQERNVVIVKINLKEPQILIGQQGQTLFELQRILKIIINKKLGETCYLDLDINDYKKNKIEYLESLAQSAADEVVVMKGEKNLTPMSSYERRVIHAKLARRDDITTESRGEGQDRHIVLKPK